MKNVVLMFCLLIGVFGLALESNAQIIDFEALMHVDEETVDHGATYEEDGFLFTNTATEESSGFPPSLAALGTQAVGFSGSTALFNNNFEGGIVLKRVDGGTFNLNSISLAELLPADVQFNVLFTGLSANGTTVAKSFTLDGLLGAQDFSFDTDFSNLVSVSWNQAPDFHQFDNVNVTPTPIPAAAWLLGSGLLGLAGLRRKNNL